jgi:hypothetical protein
MFTSTGISDRPCFICGAREKVLHVRFKDDQAQVPLCVEHLIEKLKQKAGQAPKPKVTPQIGS